MIEAPFRSVSASSQHPDLCLKILSAKHLVELQCFGRPRFVHKDLRSERMLCTAYIAPQLVAYDARTIDNSEERVGGGEAE